MIAQTKNFGIALCRKTVLVLPSGAIDLSIRTDQIDILRVFWWTQQQAILFPVSTFSLFFLAFPAFQSIKLVTLATNLIS